MTSRIDGNPEAPISTRFDRIESGQSTDRAECRKTTEADRVGPAPDAASIDPALRPAEGAPPIRSDKIDAAKKALADSTLGADAGKLADALIETMLNEKER